MPNYGSKLEKVPVFSGLHRINHAIGHTAQERGGCRTYRRGTWVLNHVSQPNRAPSDHLPHPAAFPGQSGLWGKLPYGQKVMRRKREPMDRLILNLAIKLRIGILVNIWWVWSAWVRWLKPVPVSMRRRLRTLSLLPRLKSVKSAQKHPTVTNPMLMLYFIF